MRFVYFLPVLALAGLAACGPSAATKAADAVSLVEAGETDWLQVRELAEFAYTKGVDKTAMAGIIGRSLLLGPDRETRAVDAEPYLQEGLANDDSLNWLLARGYENGWFGDEPDAVRGCTHYIAASDAYLNGAYWPTALCYLNGTGAEKDEARGFEWMEKSANAGDQNGMVSLAVMYATGVGVEQDVNQAATWYNTAIRTPGPNRAHALRGIGAMHLLGQLEGAIPQRGYAMLELAGEAGDPVAPTLLAKVSKLDEVQREAVDVQKEFLTNFYKLREDEDSTDEVPPSSGAVGE